MRKAKFKIVYDRKGVKVLQGDCRAIMAKATTNSIDAVITDPPYELNFMSKRWDNLGTAYDPEMWALAYRVLKPGGYLLSFGGSRTFHRIAVAIEDAGFEIRDSIAWLYGSGFPKSLDVSKAIDKAVGVARTGGAQQWQGFGTALKPAFEPIIVARKPLSEKTVAANVLKHGTGAINIEATRIGTNEDTRRNARGGDNGLTGTGTFKIRERRAEDKAQPDGRWPTNVVLDESQAEVLDEQSGIMRDGVAVQRNAGGQALFGGIAGNKNTVGARADQGYGGSGGASRFFPVFKYQAKAPKKERPKVDDVSHPTVKPLELMRWLVKLVTPPGGTILDPFAGTGTTAEAARLEGFKSILIEQDSTYIPLILQRLNRKTEL